VNEVKIKTYEDLLLFLNLNPEVYIVLRNGTPVPLDGEIEGDGELKILRVVSGG
jgi:sulfur carrier protein ThiS